MTRTSDFVGVECRHGQRMASSAADIFQDRINYQVLERQASQKDSCGQFKLQQGLAQRLICFIYITRFNDYSKYVVVKEYKKKQILQKKRSQFYSFSRHFQPCMERERERERPKKQLILT
jgi:hypothetical protein